MRQIDQDLLDKLKSESYRLAILIHFDFTTSIFITDCTQDVVFDGHVYNSRGFNIDNITYSTSTIIDSVNLNIDDIDRTIYAALSNKGTSLITVNIYLCALDGFGIIVPDADTNIYRGIINSWSYSPGVVRIQVTSILAQWGRVSTSRYSASCRWHIFGGSECKYTPLPEEECDRTYKTCSDYGNTDNFGGFRWLPDLVNKTLKAEEK